MIDSADFLSKCHIYKVNREKNYIAGSSTGFPNPCFGYILSGKSDFVAGDTTLHLEAGDLVFIPKGQIYTSYWSAEPYVEHYSLNFEFVSARATRNMFEFSKLHAPQIKDLFDRLYRNAVCEDIEKSYSCLRDFYDILDFASDNLKRAKVETENAVRKAIDYLESNSSEEIKVSALARMCCMSESKFYALFKETVGYTPTDYKNLIKIRRVEELLLQTDDTLEEICEKCGFSSPTYLRRVYRKFTGKSPSESRRLSGNFS